VLSIRKRLISYRKIPCAVIAISVIRLKSENACENVFEIKNLEITYSYMEFNGGMRFD